MKDHVCAYCNKTYLIVQAYSFFDHRSGRWYEGHKVCMTRLEADILYPRMVN